MNFSKVVIQVGMLFCIIAVGYFARKRRIITSETTTGLSNMLLDITIPCTIISSFNQDYPKTALLNALYVFLIALFIHVFSIVLGKILYFKCQDNIRTILWFAAVFSNCSFMGYPVVESIFGKIGIFYASIYTIAFTIFVWTFGLIIFSGKKDANSIKNVFVNPASISIFIGIIIFLSPVKLPDAVRSVIDMIGAMTTPLSMIIVGSMLSEVKLRDLFGGYYIYVSALVRLFVVPISMLLLFKAVGLNSDYAKVCIILAAMPIASFTVIFAEKFNKNAILASRCVFFSTAMSIISIPIILSLV